MERAIKHRGGVFRHEVAAAGGWGDPLERDPGIVLRDVRNELVSLASARADYGVVFAGNPLAVDVPATRALREQLRRTRNWPQTPNISRESPDLAATAERYDPRTSWPLISPALLAAVWMLMYHLPLSS